MEPNPSGVQRNPAEDRMGRTEAEEAESCRGSRDDMGAASGYHIRAVTSLTRLDLYSMLFPRAPKASGLRGSQAEFVGPVSGNMS